ncbi:MAG: hypothetical protein R3211_12385 [Balneolaceae bacterium]|nr:hypothetical protein [Balneolaceae bacterium]
MMPGFDKLIECPRRSCSHKMIRHTLESGNTSGATRWTDGRFDAPMLPQYPDFTRCPECGWFFWVEQAEEVGALPGGMPIPDDEEEFSEWREATEVQEPTFEQYLEALETKLARWPDPEKNLRLRAWQKYNDRFRPDPEKGEQTAPIKWTPASRENANNVLMLLDEWHLEESLCKAELLRELGRFGLALQMLDILEERHPDHRLRDTAERIQELAETGNSELAVVKSPY